MDIELLLPVLRLFFILIFVIFSSRKFISALRQEDIHVNLGVVHIILCGLFSLILSVFIFKSESLIVNSLILFVISITIIVGSQIVYAYLSDKKRSHEDKKLEIVCVLCLSFPVLVLFVFFVFLYVKNR